MSIVGTDEIDLTATTPQPVSIEWPNVRCAATRRMGHGRRCHPLLAITVHRPILGCEVGAPETQTKGIPARDWGVVDE